MFRTAEGLKKGRVLLDQLEEEFWKEIKIPGDANELNQELEKALKVADFFEVGRLMMEDALDRNESCGAHFREEYQTEQGEAKRDDANYAYVAAWEYQGHAQKPLLHMEPLKFEFVELKERSYK
jgi:succinate dehydrogenase / fumarate reductase flavoprotein subunit